MSQLCRCYSALRLGSAFAKLVRKKLILSLVVVPLIKIEQMRTTGELTCQVARGQVHDGLSAE